MVYCKYKPDLDRRCKGCPKKGSCDERECLNTLQEKFKDGVILSVYCATNIIDYMEMMSSSGKVSEDELKQYETTLKEATDKVKQNMKEEDDKNGMETQMIPIYFLPMVLESEKDLEDKAKDILYVGDFSEVLNCSVAVGMGLEMYMRRWTEKLMKENKIGQEVHERKAEDLKNYKTVEKEKLRQYMLDNFIVPMLDSYSANDEKKAGRIRLDFMRFSYGSPFFNYVLDMVNSIKDSNPNPDLVNAYLDVAEALYQENYESAAKIRDKITAIQGKKTEPQ